MTRPSPRSCLLVAVGCALALAPLWAAGALADLGVTEGRAKEAIFDSLTAGVPSITGKADVFKAASAETRVLFVKAVTTLARAYVESAEFAARYADHREANQPDPLPPGKTADEVLAKQRSDYEKQVEGIRAMFDQITPEQRATLERGFVEMRATFDRMEDDGRKAEIVEALKVQRARETIEFEARMLEFDRMIPKNPDVLVAARLRAFLALTNDINYGAKLVERGKKMRFVDEGLEAKSAEWKLCFRAGKDATETARTFARGWLQALEAKGVK